MMKTGKAGRLAATFAVAAACVACWGGCRHIANPMTVPIEIRDREVYQEGMERSERLRATQYSVDVFVECGPVVLASVGNQMTAVELTEVVLPGTDGALRAQLGKFPFFRVTAGDSLMAKRRARLASNAVEAGFAPKLEQRENADYTVLARIDSVYAHGDGAVPGFGAFAGAAGVGGGVATHSDEASSIGGMTSGFSRSMEPNAVEVSMTFEFYDNAKGRVVHTEHIDRDSAGLAKHNTASGALYAVRQCIAEYGRIIAREYTQENRVLATRGGGAYAWISLGRLDGASPGTHVMFYGFTDAGDIIESWDRIEEPVAYGVVVGIPDEHTCWTRVEQHSSVAVRKYHYVKIIDVPKEKAGLLERIGLDFSP